MSKQAHLTGLVAIVAVLVASAAFAAKPQSYSPTLGVSFGTLSASSTTSVPYATPYTVSGCGYNAAYGGVTVVVHSPEAISFAGQLPDADGCINVTNFSAQGAGHYQVDAYQVLRNKSSRVATMSFDLS